MLGYYFVLSCLLVTVSFLPLGQTSSPNPRGFYEKQPDGSFTPPLFLRGSEHEHYLMDGDGYIVTRDEKNWLVYATLDESGDMGSTGIPVGHKGNDGRKLRRDELVQAMEIDALNAPPNKPSTGNKSRSLSHRNLAISTKGNLNNLVLLVRFSDHKNRTLPSPSAYSLLFNGGDKTIAPTGSIKDYYLSNSYGLLTITSFVNNWILVPFTEASAGQSSGPVVLYALNYLANAGFAFSKLGGVTGQKVDFVTVLHSGYGAEWGQTDCYRVDMSQRVWSHEQSLSWKSPEGIFISAYSFTTGLWDVCGNAIARIGMIAHETGHVFGLPDLYDTDASGVGSYDVMCNCWGFDGSQLYPPMFSPWSKIQLGWIVPAKLSSNGNFVISQSANTTLIYRLDTGFPVGEYLLLENRQNIGYDRMLAQGGLAVWHIDENSDRFRQGYPGQSRWPVNGNHYRIALLQADGQYELEHGNENWGRGDLYRADFVKEIGPSWRTTFGPFPNTDKYQGGVVNNTGIRIYNIGPSSSSMSFSLSFGYKAPLGLLSTVYTNDTNSDGNMFSIKTKTAVTIMGMAINLDSSSRCPVEVWMKTGTYSGYQQSSSYWNKISSTFVEAVGVNIPTPLPNGSFEPIPLAASTVMSFYVTVSSQCGTLRYAVGTKEGNIAASNQDLSILEGSGNYYPFRNSLAPRVWSGSLLYAVQDSTIVSNKPTRKPTRRPTKKPSALPRKNIAPSTPSVQRLVTAFSGGSGLSGCMFSIQAKVALTIQTLDIHLTNVTRVPIEVWIRQGFYVGLENKKSAWTRIVNTTVSGAGLHRVTRLSNNAFTPLKVGPFQNISFYVTTATTQTALINSPGSKVNAPYSVNSDLIIMEGAGISYPFGKYISPKVWNGAILYIVG
jgi:M6 family metalloprotease-like protein